MRFSYWANATQLSVRPPTIIHKSRKKRGGDSLLCLNASYAPEFMRNDKAYSFMINIRGSPPYYQRTFYELLAMIPQLGTPTRHYQQLI